jgi:hypothetical protein
MKLKRLVKTFLTPAIMLFTTFGSVSVSAEDEAVTYTVVLEQKSYMEVCRHMNFTCFDISYSLINDLKMVKFSYIYRQISRPGSGHCETITCNELLED